MTHSTIPHQRSSGPETAPQGVGISVEGPFTVDDVPGLRHLVKSILSTDLAAQRIGTNVPPSILDAAQLITDEWLADAVRAPRHATSVSVRLQEGSVEVSVGDDEPSEHVDDHRPQTTPLSPDFDSVSANPPEAGALLATQEEHGFGSSLVEFCADATWVTGPDSVNQKVRHALLEVATSG